jgi:hypothetical protein
MPNKRPSFRQQIPIVYTNHALALVVIVQFPLMLRIFFQSTQGHNFLLPFPGRGKAHVTELGHTKISPF